MHIIFRFMLLIALLPGVSACAVMAGPVNAVDADREAAYLRSGDDLENLSGTILHIRDEGPDSAQPLVLIHGFGASLHSWDGVTDALVGEFRILRFDLPGFGLSPPDATGRYTDARSIELINAVLDSRRIDAAVLVGHSLGGRIAWRYAGRHPDRVSALVLIAPDGFESPFFEYGQPGRVTLPMRILPYLLPKALVRWILERSYGPASSPSTDTIDRYHALLTGPGVRQALLDRTRQTILQDPVPMLQSLQIPVLVIWGRQDRIIPFSNSDDYLEHIPDARLLALEGVGHLPQEEASGLTAKALRDFMNAETVAE